MANARPFIIAIAFGLIAVVLVYIYVQKVQQDAATQEMEMARVVRAIVDIPPRETITDHMVEEIEIPADMVTPDHVTELDDILGKVSMTAIYEGLPLMYQMFAEESTLEDLSRMLGSGERAVTVGVTEVSGLGGNLMPGDNVDVMVTILSNEEVGVASTFTVLTDVEVMAVGQDIGFDEEEMGTGGISKSVTLRVTPAEAEKLTLATEVGSIRLALRDPDEDFNPQSIGTALTDFTKYTDTRQDREEQALREAQIREAELAAEHEREMEILRLQYENQTSYVPEVTEDGVIEMPQLGPPPVTIELIIGGESQIVTLENEEDK